MRPPILAVDKLSKVYRRYTRPIDRLIELIFKYEQAEPVHALNPLSFRLEAGEALGIVGLNGSGKSTLLRLIAGVLTPSTGSITVRGRISALLELGGGFNPEFTGRENVFFYGAMLGFDRSQMTGIYDSILAFADIGSFIDEPVRTYSTGMFVRLAFAVAISVEPDILIVDEALAVGDVYFQQKCFDRIRELRARGTTLILVSHDSGAIFRFCDRALLLEKGTVAFDGAPRDVIERYEASLIRDRDATARPESDASDVSPDSLPTVLGANTDARIDTGEAELRKLELLAVDGTVHQTVICGERRVLRAGLVFRRAFADPHIGYKFRNRYGDVMYETNTYTMRTSIGPVEAGAYVEVDFAMTIPLADGEYTVTIGVADGGVGEASFEHQLLYAHELLDFRVFRNPAAGLWAGLVDLQTQIAVNRPSATLLGP